MQLARNILLSILSLCLGALFLYSAFTKIYSLESFERFQFTIVEYVHIPWTLATLGSRILIGLEAALGLLLVAHLYGKGKWVLKASLLLTTVFSIYLIYLWLAVGNDVNCGCFGDAIWMSPSSSLFKNAGIIIALLLLIKYHNEFIFKRKESVTYILLLSLTVTPFVIYPIPSSQPAWLNKGQYKIDLSNLYKAGKVDIPKVDLYKGKHVIAFFSLKCPHCKLAASKMHIMKERNPSLPFYMVVAGNDKYLKPFFKETNAQNLPYSKLSADEFTDIAGFSWPFIAMVKDGIVVAETDYMTMDQAQIEDWLKQP